MTVRFQAAARLPLSWILLAVSAGATDHYVDAVYGNDANGGTSTADAWRTITRALTSASGGDEIHIAPGTYDTALGEVFPLQAGTNHLWGTAGSARTLIDGGGAVVTMVQAAGANLSGLTLRNGGTGVDDFTLNWMNTALDDVRIEGMSGWGLWGNCIAPGTFDAGDLLVALQHVRVAGCGSGGISYYTNAFQGSAILEAQDSAFEGNGGTGIELIASGSHMSGSLQLTRCRAANNAGVGVQGPTIYNSGASLGDCVLVHNGGGFSGRGAIRRCTIADNAGGGVRSASGGTWPVDLSSSIVYGNGDDLVGTAFQVSFCDIGDGDYVGLNGNVAVDPMFLDAAAGDHRLRFGSPCIEIGDPATPVGALDMAGNARPIDGDLDTLELPDMGAHEHAPLFLTTTGQIGTPVRFEFFGPSGGSTTIRFSRLAPVGPATTPFGEFDLNPLSVGTFLSSSVAPGPGVLFARPIPFDVGLIGRTFSFQGLTTSAVAPQGLAFTNVVSMRIVN